MSSRGRHKQVPPTGPVGPILNMTCLGFIRRLAAQPELHSCCLAASSPIKRL